MSSKYIGELEHGGRDPALTTLFRLAAALRVRPARLMADIDQEYRKRDESSAKPPIALTREMRKLREWMEHSPQMMWFADIHQRCLFTSQGLLDWMGLTLEDVQGDKWREAIHPEDREARAAITAGAFRRREPYLSHYRMRRADGQWGSVLQQANPQFTPKGQFYGFLGVMSVLEVGAPLIEGQRRLTSLEPPPKPKKRKP